MSIKTKLGGGKKPITIDSTTEYFDDEQDSDIIPNRNKKRKAK